MKTRDLLVTVIIVAVALGSLLYIGPTLLRPSPATQEAHATEYGVQYMPYLFDSINNNLVTDLQPQWFRLYAPPATSDPYLNYQKLMKAFPNVKILMAIGPDAMGANEEGCTYRTLSTFQKGNAEASSCGWTLQDWRANVSRLVTAFSDVHAWEIWNGPDFLQGGYLCCADNVTLFARHYFDMVKEAYQVIKAHDPNDVVIVFSVELITDNKERDDWTKRFVENVWELGAANYCDAISFYAAPKGYPVFSADNPGAFWRNPLDAFETLTKKPVWITQTGMPSDTSLRGATPETQATYLTQAFNFFTQYSYIKVVIWSTLVYDEGDQFDYGLLTAGQASEQVPKPAYYAFQKFTKNASAATVT